MLVLQNADAAPTGSQSSAVRDGEAAVAAMESQWKTFAGTTMAEINVMLKDHQLDILKPGR
jgi:hypothetical protein